MMHKRIEDCVIAVVLAVSVFLVSFFYMDGNCKWGDDFAAYLSEGIAIAENRFEEQTHVNYILHNGLLPQDASSENRLVYVWGYPLILSLVYRIVGFDRISYCSVFYYKLPSLICLALLAAVVYLFMARRLNRPLALILSVMLCVNTEFLLFVEYLIYSDIVFLCSVMVTLLLGDFFFDSIRAGHSHKRVCAWGIALGISLWATYEIRLNGVLICGVIAAAHLLLWIKNREVFRRQPILIRFLPYLLFFLLKLISEALLAPATSNTADLALWTPASAISNLRYYGSLLNSWLRGLIFNRRYSWAAGLYDVTPILFGFLFLAGVFTYGLRRDLPLLLYFFVNGAGVCLLPYVQGLRYIYTLLPLFLLFAAYGLLFVLHMLKKLLVHAIGKTDPFPSWKRRHAAALLAAICFSVYRTIPIVEKDLALRSEPRVQAETYSEKAVDMYRFIREFTSPDSLIMFYKARSLYLNTERLAVKDNEEKLLQADYYLVNKMRSAQGFSLSDDALSHIHVCYENQEFVLYQIEKAS